MNREQKQWSDALKNTCADKRKKMLKKVDANYSQQALAKYIPQLCWMCTQMIITFALMATARMENNKTVAHQTVCTIASTTQSEHFS